MNLLFWGLGLLGRRLAALGHPLLLLFPQLLTGSNPAHLLASQGQRPGTPDRRPLPRHRPPPSRLFRTTRHQFRHRPRHSTIANSSSTIDIPAVTSKRDSSLPHAPKEGRCQHIFPNGKRCRKFASGSHLGLCLNHLTASAAIGAGLQQPPMIPSTFPPSSSPSSPSSNAVLTSTSFSPAS